MKTSEYAKAGVDYTKIEPFKQAMIATAERTIAFPNKRGVYVDTDFLHAHGGVFEYRGGERHAWCVTQEGLGNKNWIAELLYAENPSGPTHHDCIAYDTMMMPVNDCAAQGALPVICTDEVVANDSGWFEDKKRANDFAEGLYEACRDAGMALVAGESPVYKYLVNPRPPVKSAAVFGGTVTGIVAPRYRKITGRRLAPGDRIVGVSSSGPHANGISLFIRRIMGDEDMKGLSDGFNTKLPSGETIGSAILTRTLCYVPLVEALLGDDVDVHAILPGTGDGVGKLAYDKRSYCCRIHSWPKVPEIFTFMRELGVSIEDCLKTFNWGVGYYIFAPATSVQKILDHSKGIGFQAMEVGVVEEGERCTIFGPENNLILPPPGE